MRARVLMAGLALAVAGLVVAAAPAPAQESHGGASRTGAAPEGGGQKEISHESEECIHKLEAGGEPDDCQEAPSPIVPAADELIWGTLSFFALLFVMWKFAYPGIKKGMEARTQRIRDNLDEAEKTKAEAETILSDYQRQLADAKSESARIIEEARQTAEQMRRDLMARAEAEVNDLRQRTRQEIEAAQQRAVADLRAQVSELAIGAAEVVVQKNLDRESNKVLVDRFIEQVGASA
ncbi:MAG: F0F1 ATP synthase subunit B [Actinobacteria bacterium]|nr:F0F1 ATP synthase subunit B [Actinomycetota bacterium]MBW3649090.1 F0F1 ATP synthase subunit B [Actinomycetota bacterium]